MDSTEAELRAKTQKLEETIARVSDLEKELDILKKEVAALRSSREESKGVPKITKEMTCSVIIYKYKNSLLLVSTSKDNGTYAVKEQIKQIGAKWTNITKADGTKITGWLMLGILKEFTYEDSISNIVEKLKEQNVILHYTSQEEIM